MTRNIVVAIEPHEDGVRCGECILWKTAPNLCPFLLIKDEQPTRGPACLAAEAKLTALIEAGEVLASHWLDLGPKDGDSLTMAWLNAVAEVKK